MECGLSKKRKKHIPNFAKKGSFCSSFYVAGKCEKNKNLKFSESALGYRFYPPKM